MTTDSRYEIPCRAAYEANLIRQSARHQREGFLPPPQTSALRLEQARTISKAKSASEETYLYLAYGSNLCAATFRGARGIEPLSQVNVLVPALSLTFDLPGTPYIEPCFANTIKRNVSHGMSSIQDEYGNDDHTLLLPTSSATTHWDKGLVGVVYEVTASDYAHIIATEGGGMAYNDILVDCYALSTDPTVPVPMIPTSKPFKAHTLFAPATPEKDSATTLDRIVRPNPNYAQPSPRYLNLLTTGAEELALPDEYRAHLSTLHAYIMTSKRQEMGRYIFMMTWLPIMNILFTTMNSLKDKNGEWPRWAVKLSAAIFSSIWWSYDHVMKDKFGDGERTEGDELDQDECPSECNHLLSEKNIPTNSSGKKNGDKAGYGSLDYMDEKRVLDMV